MAFKKKEYKLLLKDKDGSMKYLECPAEYVYTGNAEVIWNSRKKKATKKIKELIEKAQNKE